MALQLITLTLTSSVIPDPEQLDHRAPIPTQEEPVAAGVAEVGGGVHLSVSTAVT